MLTGKNKERFEEWYNTQDVVIELEGVLHSNDSGTFVPFYELPLSMQFGVLQDYADSIGVDISVYYMEFDGYKCYGVSVGESYFSHSKTREEAIKAAIKAFDEIANAE